MVDNKDRNFWKPEEELLLKEWADKAQCYHILHLKAHRRFKSRNILFTIPVIIISTITGTASFAQDKFGNYAELGSILIGTMNLIVGIITTIYQFLKIAELNEAHKAAMLSWEKFYDHVKIELLKNPVDRNSPFKFLETCSNQYNHLIEFCPIIPEDIIRDFKTKFKKVKNITLPEICGRLTVTRIFNTSEILVPSIDYSEEGDDKYPKHRNSFFSRHIKPENRSTDSSNEPNSPVELYKSQYNAIRKIVKPEEIVMMDHSEPDVIESTPVSPVTNESLV